MNLLESFLLALALCVDSLVVSATSAFKSKMSYRRGLLMALIFGFCQGVFPLLGALLGGAFRDIVAAFDHWVAFGLLFVVGGKMVLDALQGSEEENRMNVTRVPIMFLLGVATSIDAFVVGIGLGLNATTAEVLLTVLIIGVVTLVVSLVGVFLGKRNVPVPERIATALAGCVLIGLGVYTLVEHLCSGAL